MAFPSITPYHHRGVQIPYVINEWSIDNSIQQDGFIFITRFKKRTLLVQSAKTGHLLVNKLSRQGATCEADEPGKLLDAEDVRFSTAPQAKRRLISPLTVRGRTRIYFPEVMLWQRIGPAAQSVYLRYYNGGTLADITSRAHRAKRLIPEHFIWHVFVTLIEAVRYLHTGVLPGTDGPPKDDWEPIYHRDISPSNVFVHFPIQPSPQPELGYETNAYPEVILGDFGKACEANGNPHKVKLGAWGRAEREEWQDTYSLFGIIKSLYCACFEFEDDAAIYRIGANALRFHRPGNAESYSDDLIHVLERWEYRGFNRSDILDVQTIRNETAANYTRIPSLETIVQDILPLARSKVEAYQNLQDGTPNDWTKLDMTWSRAKGPMPYKWRPSPLDGSDDQSSDDGAEDRVREKSPRILPEPDPYTKHRALRGVLKWEEEYPDNRPPHKIVSLHYQPPNKAGHSSEELEPSHRPPRHGPPSGPRKPRTQPPDDSDGDSSDDGAPKAGSSKKRTKSDDKEAGHAGKRLKTTPTAGRKEKGVADTAAKGDVTTSSGSTQVPKNPAPASRPAPVSTPAPARPAAPAPTGTPTPKRPSPHGRDSTADGRPKKKAKEVADEDEDEGDGRDDRGDGTGEHTQPRESSSPAPGTTRAGNRIKIKVTNYRPVARGEPEPTPTVNHEPQSQATTSTRTTGGSGTRAGRGTGRGGATARAPEADEDGSTERGETEGETARGRGRGGRVGRGGRARGARGAGRGGRGGRGDDAAEDSAEEAAGDATNQGRGRGGKTTRARARGRGGAGGADAGSAPGPASAPPASAPPASAPPASGPPTSAPPASAPPASAPPASAPPASAPPASAPPASAPPASAPPASAPPASAPPAFAPPASAPPASAPPASAPPASASPASASAPDPQTSGRPRRAARFRGNYAKLG
ncbi:hypothetical protein F5Y17DRAFT_238880 [Xylariaceae sp. FL0594]|nr:hypothetical protein F5Y17DRAFT_238880 [Xylariaceae sp. FL0594]